MQKLKKNAFPASIIALALLGYALFFIMMYGQVAITTWSDTTAHVQDTFSGSYSSNAAIIRVAHFLLGNEGIALIFAAFHVGTYFATYFLLKTLLKGENKYFLALGAIMSNLEAPIILAQADSVYYGMGAGSVYHNQTYITMKFFGVMALIFAFKIIDKFSEKMSFLNWCFFTAFLALSTSSKPSFVFALAPVILLFLIADLIKTKFKNIKNEFIFGCGVFPSVVLCLFQFNILFPSSAQESGSGIELVFGDLYRNFPPVLYNIFRSTAFILAVLIVYGLVAFKEKWYSLTLLAGFIAWCQAFFLIETGVRRFHGNFGWGYNCFAFFCFAISFCGFLKGARADEKGGAPVVRIAKAIVPLTFAAMHLFSGISYFAAQLRASIGI